MTRLYPSLSARITMDSVFMLRVMRTLCFIFALVLVSCTRIEQTRSEGAFVNQGDRVLIATLFEDSMIKTEMMIVDILEKIGISVWVRGGLIGSVVVKRDQAELAISCLKSAPEIKGLKIRIGFDCWKPRPKIEGHVVEVYPKTNTALISVGKIEGVHAGFEFSVYRGQDYVGELIVIRVEPSRSECRMLEDASRGTIQVGDPVSAYIWNY